MIRNDIVQHLRSMHRYGPPTPTIPPPSRTPPSLRFACVEQSDGHHTHVHGGLQLLPVLRGDVRVACGV